jgi:hypothetical protein
LQRLGYNAHIIDSGQGLVDGLLYDEEVYTLRPKIYYDNSSTSFKQTGSLTLMYNAAGRSDLISLNVDHNVERQGIHRFACRCLYEIKTVDAMKNESGENSALRECCEQLIGINASNFKMSPSVLLTNLNYNHYVLFIQQPELGTYNLVIERFKYLFSAVYRADKLADRSCFSQDFGRMPSRAASFVTEEDFVESETHSFMDDAEFDEKKIKEEINTGEIKDTEIISKNGGDKTLNK